MLKVVGTFVLLFTFAAMAAAQPQKPEQSLNLIEATLNTRPLFRLTVDDVSDMFGRPTAVDENRPLVAAGDPLLGPQIFYHDLGISFWFKSKNRDGGTLSHMTVHFSKTWDVQTKKYFQPYAGSITSNLNGNWKLEKTMSEFSLYNPTVQTPADIERSLKQLGVYRCGSRLYYQVWLKFTGFKVNLLHDPVTKFLEQVTILSE